MQPRLMLKTFTRLSEITGKDKIIWRFDPYILTGTTGVEELLRKTENIGNQLNKYTKKMVFSFADINKYRKVQNNLQREKIKYIYLQIFIYRYLLTKSFVLSE